MMTDKIEGPDKQPENDKQNEALATQLQKDMLHKLIDEHKISMQEERINALTCKDAQVILDRFQNTQPHAPTTTSAKKPYHPANKETEKTEKEQYIDDGERQHLAAMQFDSMDEEQIVEILEGRSNKKYTYTINIGGKQVDGISYAGTVDAARFYSENLVGNGFKPLEVVDYQLIETDTAFRAFVRVKDGKSGLILPGYASQPKKIKVYTSKDHTTFEMRDDDKADVKCVSKATRNAYRNIMPASYIDAYIAAVKKGSR
jgi:hypothetical protein